MTQPTLPYLNKLRTLGDTYAWMNSGVVFGGTEEALQPYICYYSIQEACDAAEVDVLRSLSGRYLRQ